VIDETPGVVKPTKFKLSRHQSALGIKPKKAPLAALSPETPPSSPATKKGKRVEAKGDQHEVFFGKERIVSNQLGGDYCATVDAKVIMVPDNVIFEDDFVPNRASMDALLAVCQRFGLVAAPSLSRQATPAEVQTLMWEEFPGKGLEGGFW
jgi:hypothetical protein